MKRGSPDVGPARHHYFNVDLDTSRRTVIEHLPALVDATSKATSDDRAGGT